ncbi:MAG: hypothetical protein HC818_05815 [Synechococcaceae cyanobacterium RM1_1_27]|nr:hypothetical protein [Synechococcaceae cyanobacterium RM1_1_27]
MPQDPTGPDSSDHTTSPTGDPAEVKVAQAGQPKATLQNIFSMVLFCCLVLLVAYLGWNLIQALLSKLALTRVAL